jgi:hypothetical protein
LKTGRNEPCQCGSGRKYKKCCLANDEVLVRQADAAGRAEASKVSSNSLPAKPLSAPSEPKAKEPRQLTETEIKLDALWAAFDALARPTAVQMNELLGNLLVLPPDMTDWNEVIHAFARHDHPELPAVFRRIAAGVSHIKGTGMAFFYWAAAEEFIRKQMVGLLPEVASGFCRLDGGAYDADALAHLEDFLLAAHFDAETLHLAEQFLPAARDGARGGQLMSYVVPNMCELIFQLRVGVALRLESDAGASPETVVQALRRDIEEEVDTEAVRRAAIMICDRGPRSAWTRADFDLIKGDISKSDAAWQACLRLYDTLMGVAREAWQNESFPPACGFRGLSNVLESVYEARAKTQAKTKKESKPGNLLDCLNVAGLDERIARSCRGILGINLPRARLMLEAYELLLRFAERHQLISAGNAAATQSELIRLHGVLYA